MMVNGHSRVRISAVVNAERLRHERCARQRSNSLADDREPKSWGPAARYRRLLGAQPSRAGDARRNADRRSPFPGVPIRLPAPTTALLSTLPNPDRRRLGAGCHTRAVPFAQLRPLESNP